MLSVELTVMTKCENLTGVLVFHRLYYMTNTVIISEKQIGWVVDANLGIFEPAHEILVLTT